MDTNISFKSNIKFVDKRTLQNLKKSRAFKYVDYGWFETISSRGFDGTDLLCTEKVRTCTAGAVVWPHKKAKGFHIFHSQENHRLVEWLFHYMFKTFSKPERALLIGAKNLYDTPFSLPNFRKAKELIGRKTNNISFFEGHSFVTSETDFCYSLKDDTWTIYSSFIKDGKEKPVITPQRLKRAFQQIQIASGDRLFVGNREITRKKSPELFVKFSECQKTEKGFLSFLRNFLQNL